MSKKPAVKTAEVKKTRAKPVKIPLGFVLAVEGLLAVKPTKKNVVASKRSPKKTKRSER